MGCPGRWPGTKRREPRNLGRMERRMERCAQLPGQLPPSPTSCSPRSLSQPGPLEWKGAQEKTQVTQKPKMLHPTGNLGRGNSNPRYLGRALDRETCGHTTF